MLALTVNNELLNEDILLLEELRDQAQVRLESYRQCLRRFYGKKFFPRKFQTGDLVLRRAFDNKKELNAGKLDISWEGSYIIREVGGRCTFRLTDADGKLIPQTWNALHLKKNYA